MKPLSFAFLIWPTFFKALSNYQVTELSKINTAALCNHQKADTKTSVWPGPRLMSLPSNVVWLPGHAFLLAQSTTGTGRIRRLWPHVAPGNAPVGANIIQRPVRWENTQMAPRLQCQEATFTWIPGKNALVGEGKICCLKWISCK